MIQELPGQIIYGYMMTMALSRGIVFNPCVQKTSSWKMLVCDASAAQHDLAVAAQVHEPYMTSAIKNPRICIAPFLYLKYTEQTV